MLLPKLSNIKCDPLTRVRLINLLEFRFPVPQRIALGRKCSIEIGNVNSLKPLPNGACSSHYSIKLTLCQQEKIVILSQTIYFFLRNYNVNLSILGYVQALLCLCLIELTLSDFNFRCSFIFNLFLIINVRC